MSNVKYGEYLQLDQILNAQSPKSEELGRIAHDEMLFIITHQAYELWFKQILTELKSILRIFSDETLDDKKIGTVNARLDRIVTIQRVLIHQVDIIETMTSLDFMEFRDLLIPASGFQSVQFKEIEIILGLRADERIPAERDFFHTRLNQEERNRLEELAAQDSLHDRVEGWLERTPFLEHRSFDFWKAYATAVQENFEEERQIIENNPSISAKEKEFQLEALEMTISGFNLLLDKEHPEEFASKSSFKMNQRAVLAALFIKLYRDEPILLVPFNLLTHLVEIGELWTNWRQRHAQMVHRMLGTRIGTGGSSGHTYLRKTTENKRFFSDLFDLASYIIPRSKLPKLPDDFRSDLGFQFESPSG